MMRRGNQLRQAARWGGLWLSYVWLLLAASASLIFLVRREWTSAVAFAFIASWTLPLIWWLTTPPHTVAQGAEEFLKAQQR